MPRQAAPHSATSCCSTVGVRSRWTVAVFVTLPTTPMTMLVTLFTTVRMAVLMAVPMVMPAVVIIAVFITRRSRFRRPDLAQRRDHQAQQRQIAHLDVGLCQRTAVDFQ